MTYETAIETLHEFIQEVERQNEMQGEGFDFYMPQDLHDRACEALAVLETYKAK